MDVILLEKVRNFGNLGDKVSVKAGYARNFLIPQGVAIPATDEHLQEFEARRAELEQKAAEQLAAAEKRAEGLNALTIKIEALASDEGKLYGSIGPVEIANAITEAGVEVEKREIDLPEGPIHSIGQYDIHVQVHSDVVATVAVEIGAAS